MTTTDTGPRNHLHDHFYTQPLTAKQTMTSKGLKETMLNTYGEIIVHASFWTIKHKHLGAGAYLVWVEPRKRKEVSDD